MRDESREELLEEYRDTLKKHDFSYMYSDDNRYYKRGKEKSLKLQNLQLQLAATGMSMKELKMIWNEYAEGEFKYEI